MFRPLRDPELRNAILFVFGLTGITILVVAYVLGGPEPPKWTLIVLGAFAFGPAAVTSAIRAWRGMNDGSNPDEGDPDDLAS